MQPRWRGNILCFFYNKDNKPMITIGPDWKFSAAKLVIFNAFMIYMIPNHNPKFS
jgi:hypothetical protein